MPQRPSLSALSVITDQNQFSGHLVLWSIGNDDVAAPDDGVSTAAPAAAAPAGAAPAVGSRWASVGVSGKAVAFPVAEAAVVSAISFPLEVEDVEEALARSFPPDVVLEALARSWQKRSSLPSPHSSSELQRQMPKMHFLFSQQNSSSAHGRWDGVAPGKWQIHADAIHIGSEISGHILFSTCGKIILAMCLVRMQILEAKTAVFCIKKNYCNI